MASAFSLSASPRPSHTYTLADNMRRLGQELRSSRWQVSYLMMLIADEGFPAPLPLPTKGGLTTDVKLRSRWSRDCVDRWFHDRTPPGTDEVVDARAMREAGDVMDQRAARFAPPRLVGGTDVEGEVA